MAGRAVSAILPYIQSLYYAFQGRQQTGGGSLSSLMIQDNNAARMAAAAARLSPSPRRWSRTNSPYHYGSQLLCEIINYNAAHQQFANNQNQQDRQYQQTPTPPPPPLTRLPPPPISPISTIGLPAAPPMFPPPPLSFIKSYPDGVRPVCRRSSSLSSDECGAAAAAAACCDVDIGHHGAYCGEESPVNLVRRRRAAKRYPLELQKAIRDVQFIQNHMKRADEYDEVLDVCTYPWGISLSPF